jgi:hypothetical protein
MQNRYVGDIGDYSKFVLIKYFYKFYKKCGIIWYLYPNENHNNDGKFRNYDKFKLQDKEMVKLMQYFSKYKERERNIQELEKILINNGFELTFFNECIEKNCDTFFSNWRERKKYREKWFSKALEKVKNCDVVFADPDNGIEIKSCPIKSRKKSGKYIFFDEIEKLLQKHKIVIIYQHFIRKKQDIFINEKEKEIRDKIKDNFKFYAIKFKKVSPRAYLILSKENLENEIKKFCNKFTDEFELLKG